MSEGSGAWYKGSADCNRVVRVAGSGTSGFIDEPFRRVCQEDEQVDDAVSCWVSVSGGPQQTSGLSRMGAILSLFPACVFSMIGSEDCSLPCVGELGRWSR